MRPDVRSLAWLLAGFAAGLAVPIARGQGAAKAPLMSARVTWP